MNNSTPMESGLLTTRTDINVVRPMAMDQGTTINALSATPMKATAPSSNTTQVRGTRASGFDVQSQWINRSTTSAIAVKPGNSSPSGW